MQIFTGFIVSFAISLQKLLDSQIAGYSSYLRRSDSYVTSLGCH